MSEVVYWELRIRYILRWLPKFQVVSAEIPPVPKSIYLALHEDRRWGETVKWSERCLDWRLITSISTPLNAYPMPNVASLMACSRASDTWLDLLNCCRIGADGLVVKAKADARSNSCDVTMINFIGDCFVACCGETVAVVW